MLTGAVAGAAFLRADSGRAAAGGGYRAIAFDGFVLFDPRPITALAGQLFPEKGAELMNLWRVKQFDYQWLRALSGRYRDFWECTEGALTFAARSLKIDLAPDARDRLLHAWLQLKAWPDVAPALRSLKQANLRLAPLANFTARILETAIASSGLQGLFDDVISTDRARTFKPDPRAYQLGIDVLRVRREELVFVPSAGWDAAGSKWFGYPTFWINRTGAPPDELGVAADGSGAGMEELVAFVKPRANK
jgi:2-haloacid dehalogenase